MSQAPIPGNEAPRLARLKALEVLDTLPELMFDQLTQAAAAICGVPIALVSLVDAERQWFKANVGLPDATQTPRDVAFCAHAILSPELMEVEDATQDARFAANPLVTGQPDIRFYAGAPITMTAGERIGTLCVIDRVPRKLSEPQRAALMGLSRAVAVGLLERERRLQLLKELAASEENYRRIIEYQTELVSLAMPDGTLTFVNEAYASFFGFQAHDVIGRNLFDFVPEGDRAAVKAHLDRVGLDTALTDSANRMVRPDGSIRWVAWTNRRLPARQGQPPLLHSVGRDVTAQKAAEEALSESERRYRQLYESTPAMLHSIDQSGKLVSVSDTWLDKMGYMREEVIGQPSSSFMAPESQQRARTEVLPAFFQTGRCTEVPYEMVTKSGRHIDVLLSAVLERQPDGSPLRSLAVLQDVSDIKATQATLRHAAHTLQLVMDNLPARISYWAPDHRNIFANKAFLRAFGGEAEEIAGRYAWEVMGAAWWDRIEDVVLAALAGEEQRLELSFTDADGGRVDAELHFEPDTYDEQVRGVFVIALDTTARRRAERELENREKKFRLLVDGVRDYAIFMLDEQGCVTTWNPGAARIKGFSEQEVIGRYFSIFFTPEDVAAGKPAGELAIAARDGRFEDEDWRCRHDGSRFWAHVLVSALRDDEGKLIGYAKIVRDLTSQRMQRELLTRVVELAPSAMLMVNTQGTVVLVNAQAEAMFGYDRADLLGQPVDTFMPRLEGNGDLLAVRKDGSEFPVEIGLSSIETTEGMATLAAIVDITERRLQQAEAEQSLIEKETLLKEVYHRVKNNLQVVQSLLNLQRQALPEGVARTALDDSVQRIRAMALVHEKLYQSGNLSAISLQGYTKDLLNQIAEANGIDRHSVQLHADVPDLPTGLDSAIPFGLLLTELVSNSLKHAFVDRREGEVKVRVAPQASGALLTVSDNGVGFKDDFDTASRTSMGLKLAASLSRQLGGSLRVRSDGGTVFEAMLTRL